MTDSTHAELALDGQPWPVATADSRRRFTFANAAFSRWTGAMRGDPIDRLRREQPQLLEALEAALAGQAPPPVRAVNETDHVTYAISLKALGPTGAQRAVALYAGPAQSDAERDRLERVAVLDSVLDQISLIPYSCDDPKEMLDRMVKIIVAGGVADSAVVYVNHNNRWSVRHAAGLMEDLVCTEVSEHQVRPSLKALREDRVVVINDIASADRDTRRWLAQCQIAAMMDVNIDVPWGDLVDFAVHYHAPARRRFNDDDRIFLERVGSRITMALHNIGLVDQLRQQKGQLDIILENIPAGVFVLDADLRLMRANNAFRILFGVNPAKVRGQTVDRFIPSPLGSKMHEHCRQALTTKKTLHYEELLPLPGGDCRVFFTRKVALWDDDGRAYAVISIATDITERKRMEEEMRHVAHHDPLTGLPNRRLLAELLDLELANAKRNHNYLALLYLDLNRFKEINDNLGHEVGDEVLRQVASRLTRRMRAADLVARIGGDEFNVVLANLPSPDRVSAAIPALLSAFNEPFAVGDDILNVSTSIGVSVFPGDADSADTLRSHADVAMYVAKRKGGNQFAFFSPEAYSAAK